MTMPHIHPFISRVNLIISQHLQDPDFGTQELAEYLFISRVQLYRKTKQITGHSPTTHIRHFRLKRGKRLLQKTQLSIKEIAYKVGFKDPAHFTNAFKERYGLPPSAVRM